VSSASFEKSENCSGFMYTELNSRLVTLYLIQRQLQRFFI